MKLRVPYGAGIQEVDIAGVDIEVGRSVAPAEVDEHGTLERAFAAPIASPTLSEFLAGAPDAVVIVNDAKRATPTARILEFMRDELDTVPDLTFIIATGTHREPTPEEVDRILKGAADRDGARVVAHDGRNTDSLQHMGRTPRGTEVTFNRLVTGASRIVVVGSVEPHYFAGFTGGRKAFLPGVAGYDTVRTNHSHTLLPEPQLMRLTGNPVHEDMMDALDLMGDRSIFSVMVVMDGQHRVCGAFTGDIRRSFDAAVDKSTEVYSVDVSGKADVVVAVALSPADTDLYQAHKAIESSKLALVEGGILILVAECSEGFGNDAFVDHLSSSERLEDVVGNVGGKPGGNNYNIGDHKAVKLAELAMRSEIWMLTGLPSETIERMFFRPVESLQTALESAIALKGPDAKVLCLMDAANTVPRVR